jgi:hypothetical protein
MERDGTPVRVTIQDARELPHRPANLLYPPPGRLRVVACEQEATPGQPPVSPPSASVRGSERDLYGAQVVSFFSVSRFPIKSLDNSTAISG